MADLHAQLLAQEEAQAHRTELETNVHRLRGELEASRSRYATEVHSRTERASTQDRLVMGQCHVCMACIAGLAQNAYMYTSICSVFCGSGAPIISY